MWAKSSGRGPFDGTNGRVVEVKTGVGDTAGSAVADPERSGHGPPLPGARAHPSPARRPLQDMHNLGCGRRGQAELRGHLGHTEAGPLREGGGRAAKLSGDGRGAGAAL